MKLLGTGVYQCLFETLLIRSEGQGAHVCLFLPLPLQSQWFCSRTLS